ncbi:MAG: DUF3142 domain-containing protein [Thermoanaerobaculia bacterium]|nr:DUF3142 domain-containing protein [Thermoanaerobaculia bacterium]
MDHRAYVWQRQGTPALLEAVRNSGRFSRLLFLAAEIDPNSKGRPRFLLESFESVRQSPREIGLCIRIRELQGRFAGQPDALNAVLETLRELQERARSSGIVVSEWQLDYDAPESGLEDYAALVRAARAVVSPLTLTALPTWLKRGEAFSDLVGAADGFVLQLHGWDSEASGPDAMRVLDLRRLERWVDQAAKHGSPFHVALPTYSYLAALDSTGKAIGLAAEAGPSARFAAAPQRLVGSEASGLAGQVGAWTERRSPLLAGVVWFRLPVRGDRLNWAPETLLAVVEGRVPRAELRAAAEAREPGLFDLQITNVGESTEPLPRRLLVELAPGQILAADAIHGYVLQQMQDGSITLDRTTAAPELLWPGEAIVVGWVRTSSAAHAGLRVELGPAGGGI